MALRIESRKLQRKSPSSMWSKYRQPILTTFLLCLVVLAGCKDREPYSDGSFDAEFAYASSDKVPVFDHEADLCEGQPTNSERVPIERVAKPPLLKRYRDPAFNTPVVRITDSSEGTVHKPLYSTIQAWNANETLLLLYRTGTDGPAHVLFDGLTYEEKGVLDIVPTDLEEVFWSHSDPDKLFYVSAATENAGNFLELNVRDGSSRLIEDFNKLCTQSSIRFGNDVMMQSLDDDIFGLRCLADSGDFQGDIMFTYRISTGEFVVADLAEPWNTSTAPRATPTSKAVYQQGTVLDHDLVKQKSSLDVFDYETHGDLGRTRDGADALYLTTFNVSPKGCDGDLWKGVGHLIEFNLETGTCRSLINESGGWPYTTSGTHVSAVAQHRPGWIAMSSIGYGNFDYFSNGRRPPALMSEIYLVDAKPGRRGRVCRLAQHRSFGKSAKRGDYPPYFGEPHASISPSGTRIIFGSDWYDSGAVDTYVVELPAFQNARAGNP